MKNAIVLLGPVLASCLLLVFLPEARGGGPVVPSCPGALPDGLDQGDCCEKVTLNLPPFPKIVNNAAKDRYICFDNCTVDEVFNVDVCLEAPEQVIANDDTPLCGFYTTQATLTLCNKEMTQFAGQLLLIYSRTWLEQSSDDYQVWRFLVNGDLVVKSELDPCPVPTCAGDFGGRVRFWGYIDYVENLDTNETAYAYAFNHDCDAIDHVSPYNRNGTYHASRSYTFVGPGQFFFPSVAVPAEMGTITNEVLRPIDLSQQLDVGNICYAEEPLSQGDDLDPTLFCYCSPQGTQYARSQFSVTSTCMTTLTTDPATCPNGFVSKSIGSWVPLGNTYPGQETLRINIASYDNDQACQTGRKFDFFYGVTTKGGWTPFAITGPPLAFEAIDSTFIDQSSALRLNLTPTKNVRYWSDFVINLNLDCQ